MTPRGSLKRHGSVLTANRILLTVAAEEKRQELPYSTKVRKQIQAGTN